MWEILEQSSAYSAKVNIVAWHGIKRGSMAQLRLDSPEAFNVCSPDEWPCWKKRFQQFRLASGLSEDSNVSTLLYCMGQEGEETLASITITTADREQYDRVLAQFDSFFNVRRNVIFERAKFNRSPSSTVNQWNSLSQHSITSRRCANMVPYVMKCCKSYCRGNRGLYPIRAPSDDWGRDSGKAKTLVKQREALHDQQLTLKGQIKSEPHLDAVQSYPSSKGKSPTTGKAVRESASQYQPPTRCSFQSQQQATSRRCGQGSHPRQQCPAGDAECHKCHKWGHYGQLCRTKSVAEVLDPELPDDFTYLNTIGSNRSAMWTVNVSVNGWQSQFKVDTGAEVTVISSAVSTQLGITDPQPMTNQLRGPDGTPLCTVEQATVKLAYQGRECTHTLFILPSLEHKLLGLPAIRDLHVWQGQLETAS